VRNRLLVVMGSMALAAGCGGDSGTSASPSGVTDLQVVDLQVGTGAEAVTGALATVDYTLWLYQAGAPDNKGTLVETSVGRAPFSFVVGAGQVIPGFDRGVTGMHEGGQRRLVIPPSLGYGSSSQGSIPPNSTLIFEITLLRVQ